MSASSSSSSSSSPLSNELAQLWATLPYEMEARVVQFALFMLRPGAVRFDSTALLKVDMNPGDWLGRVCRRWRIYVLQATWKWTFCELPPALPMTIPWRLFLRRQRGLLGVRKCGCRPHQECRCCSLLPPKSAIRQIYLRCAIMVPSEIPTCLQCLAEQFTSLRFLTVHLTSLDELYAFCDSGHLIGLLKHIEHLILDFPSELLNFHMVKPLCSLNRLLKLAALYLQVLYLPMRLCDIDTDGLKTALKARLQTKTVFHFSPRETRSHFVQRDLYRFCKKMGFEKRSLAYKSRGHFTTMESLHSFDFTGDKLVAVNSETLNGFLFE